ncbi:hypothetical protein EDC94DRAFT_598826, partial [Helicostylum pulchrum]
MLFLMCSLFFFVVFFLWSFFCGLLSLWCICYDISVGAWLTFGLLLVLWLLCICYVVLFWCKLYDRFVSRL